VRPEDVLLARKWVVEHQLDAIASTDGDSDRPLLADDTGEWLRGDVLGMLCARELNADVVVTPISSNTLVEKCASFVRVLRTKIGSPFVIAAMNEALIAHGGVVCGYEANGGFLLGSDIVLQGKLIKALPTRDAILPIVTVLANSRNEDISQLLSQLPQRHTVSDRLQGFLSDRRDHLMGWLRPEDTVKRNVQVEEIFAPIARSSLTMISFLDGARMTFANDRVIHLRASGNAPELRCYTEAESCDLATELNRATLAAVAELFP
jgi:phosphomannomutase